VSTARRGWAGAALGLLAAVIVLGPLLVRRGYVLSYDMVFVPHMPITATTWGTDGSVPRAVPEDLLVALAGHVLPGDVIQKVLLCLVFVLGAAGVARLLDTLPGGLAAAAVYVWNPWVRERLVIGHWTYLLGLAVLPWAVEAAGRLREGQRTATSDTAIWVVVAALCGSTPGLVVAATAALVGGWPGSSPWRGQARRVAVGVLAPAVAAAMVWLLPALLRPGGVAADPAGVRAFAARADTDFGTWGSLFTLGGIWNPATWPSERRVFVLALAATVAIAAALVLGLRPLLRELPGPGLVAAGLFGLLLSGAGATPGLYRLMRFAQLHVVGGGILRDGQKYLMPFVLLTSVTVGLAVERMLRARSAAPLAVLLVGVPVLVLPSLAWGVDGRLAAVPYPAEWLQVQRLVAAQPGHADVVSLPFTAYRRLAWNGDRVTLDPMPRLLDRVVLVNDSLPLSTVTVAGESRRAKVVEAAIGSGASLVPVLRREGVGLAVLDLTAPGADAMRTSLAGLPVLHRGPGLLVVDVGPASPAPDRPQRLVLGGVVGWALLVLAAISVAVARLRVRRRRPVLPSLNGSRIPREGDGP
jgi:hypothetical protein